MGEGQDEGPVSAPAAIGRNTLIGEPQTLRRLAGLKEHIDRDAAARIPVAADAKPVRLGGRNDLLGDIKRALFMKARMIAEAGQIQLKRLALDDASFRHIVDHQMREIGLTGDRADIREFGCGEADQIARDGVRIGHAFKDCGFRGGRHVAGAAQLAQGLIGRVTHAGILGDQAGRGKAGLYRLFRT